MKAIVKHSIKKIIQTFGIEIRRIQNSDSHINKDVLGYISAKKTIDAAAKSGLSVGDYLETIWNQKNSRHIIIDEMNKFDIFNKNIKNICEIGTGAGLYAEKTVELCQPVRYESYEPDRNWAEWLARKYNIISHDADGKSLSYTSSFSIDLILAHGVFVYLPFLVTCRYFKEIVRVANDKSYVVFDIFSEECFDDETTRIWLESDQTFPTLLCKKYVVNLFEKNGFSSVGEFFNHKFNVGKSKYLIFKKESSHIQK